MVERPHTGPLPPLHPVPGARGALPDGQGVPQPPLTPRERRRYRLVAAAVVAVVLAAIALGRLL